MLTHVSGAGLVILNKEFVDLRKDYSNFKELPSVMYQNKQICVTGTISEYKGKPQIVVTKPEEIIMQ